MLTLNDPKKRLRDALATVRANPSGVSALDAEDLASQRATEAEAKRLANAAAKVNAELDALTEELVAEFISREQEVLRQAARQVARNRLELKHGLISPQAASLGSLALKLTTGVRDRVRSRLERDQSLPAEILKAREPAVDDVAARIEQRKGEIAAINERKQQHRQQRHEARQVAIAKRKAEAGIGGKKAA